ncbi:TonB-dependent receptor domain-containing protein [Aureibacter tunicatorum]|uniref:Outer membrane receptor protein involved in Fe transport n=1 Tax=Aureibacter tunicatorum TaxID=866807 RepID=A0AAE4BRN2_9BACT|nr:TonB-dependent receptor [Aureibacter tunicatorum]MDR6238015.1 outer membrane receptor protein involved in Fe transport [Aureibacter tunicatorum]BDD03048.1 TonB-dependent receptor [Aureibacter tunicatorum]
MKVYFLPLLILIWASSFSLANPAADGNVRGQLVEDGTQEPVGYASVAIYDQNEKLMGGAISDDNGNFVIKGLAPGTYKLEVKFVGFETLQIENVVVGATTTRLGEIKLDAALQMLEDIEVTASKPEVEYKIDRKVINVDKMATALSGSAVEILENVPSVEVDMDGNVSLRGSGNFTVFIDGRPSVFKGSDALSQIPASMIENIELITNPSAKYDPDGTSGIINIITKKKSSGLSGVVNLNGGVPSRYGADAMFSYKANEKFTYHFGGDYNNMERRGTRYAENTTFGEDTVLRITDGDRARIRESYNIKGGLDFTPNDNNRFSLMLAGGKSDNIRDNSYMYENYYIRNGVMEPTENPVTHNYDDMRRSYQYFSVDADYLHKFSGRKGHELSMSVHYGYSEGDEDNITLAYSDETNSKFGEPGRRGLESSIGHEFRYKLDYVRPIGENSKLEAGYQLRMDLSDENNGNYSKAEVDSDWVLNEKFSYQNEFTKDIHAIYGTYSGEWDKLGYQLGIRGEYTFRETNLINVGERTVIERFDWFPTAHFSYQLPSDQQLMASYSRRINRPSNWWLEPFPTFMDAFNVRIGDPGIEPEYIDSFELGYTKTFSAFSLSAEGFFRQINNRTEFVKEIWDDEEANPNGDIFMNTRTNVGQERNYGLELMVNADPLKWWSFNLSGTITGFTIDGSYKDQVFDRQDSYFNFRMSNDFLLTKTTRLQIAPVYTSGRQSAQGYREGFVMVNMALKQDFMDKKLSATLQGRNILNTFKWESTSNGPDFNSMMRFEMMPSFTFSLTYRINNYRNKRSGKGGNGGGESGGFDM